MINPEHKLSIRQQCKHLGLHRSYAQYHHSSLKDETTLANLIAELYCKHPVYGYRRMTYQLKTVHHLTINPKKTLRIMREMGIQAIYPKPCTTKRNPSHAVYPYLLRDLNITHCHQVWQTDLTYIRTPHGFMYLNAFIDVFSRTVLGWNLSNTLETASCLVALDNAIASYGTPKMINTDQGCQYTSTNWIAYLKSQAIAVSMNSVGRSNDNAYIERLWRTIKYEGFVLYPFKTISELKETIRETVHWYNHHRPHSSLNGQTPFQKLQQHSVNQYCHSPFIMHG